MVLCRLVQTLTCLAGVAVAANALAADTLTPFKDSAGDPPAPWHVVGLPGQTKPFTQFAVVEIDGKKALRVEAKESYGNVVHPVKWTAPTAKLAWQWRVDEQIGGADLRTKQGDDTAIKVCVSFDMPLDQVPFVERQLLKIGQSKTTEPIPTATVCYVWDTALPVGTEIDNAFTRRIRYIVLESGPEKVKQWKAERRDVIADFKKLFNDESPKAVPAISAVAVGADADNTKSRSVGYVADLVLGP